MFILLFSLLSHAEDPDPFDGKDPFAEEDIQSDEKPENREIVMIRKKVLGEYIVTAHAYSKYSEGPLPVTIRIVRISPRRVIHDTTFVFDEAHEEQTVCRFTVGKKGKIDDVSHTPIELAHPILMASPP